MFLKNKRIAPATADADGVCQSQTPAEAGALTINGALASGGVATFDIPRHVSIASVGDDSGRTFTITGTDHLGDTITDTVTGANASSAFSAKNFKTVTGVSVDNATAAAVTVGSADQLHWTYPVGCEAGNVGFGVMITGTMSATIKATNFNIMGDDYTEYTANFRDVKNSNASFFGSVSIPSTAVRVDLKGIGASAVAAITLTEEAV